MSAAVESTVLHDPAAKCAHNEESSKDVVLRYWCYALHALLLFLQIALLALLWKHPEHNVTISFENNVLTIGLSAFLQAIYTLYTMILLLITHRFALTEFLSRRQNLTVTRDFSGAWDGLGAAIASLWRQKRFAAMTKMALTAFVYLACISVLHVASPTIMGFEPYNGTIFTTVSTNSTWPWDDPSFNPEYLDMQSLISLAPIIYGLPGLSTDGLTNNTLYDTLSNTTQRVNALVTGNSIQASCGLLPNLTLVEQGPQSMTVNASMDDVGEVSFHFPTYQLLDELIFSYECVSCWNYAVLHLVASPIEWQLDDSAGNNTGIKLVWNNTASINIGGSTQNDSMFAYVVACSFEASSLMYNLETGDILESTQSTTDSPTNVWSTWSPIEDNLGSQLNQMVSTAFSMTSCGGTCGGQYTLDDYLLSLIASNSNATTTQPEGVSPHQFGNALSQLAAQFIWIAGQLGGGDGGFNYPIGTTQVAQNILRWRLNINTIPVIFTFTASFILFAVICIILGAPSKSTRNLPLVKGTTTLEMLWTGAHNTNLHQRLHMVDYRTLERLRPGGIFSVDLTNNLDTEGMEEVENMQLLDRSGTNGLQIEDGVYVPWTPKYRGGVKLSPKRWCYLLHGFFVLFHVVLLLLLIRHPEHQVVFQAVDGMSSIVLAESLQLSYVVYTLVLVFITQRLSLSQAVMRKQMLTSIHDISQAWSSIGSALLGVWQQTKISSSLPTILAITAYYLCVSVLHIISTTVIQFQIFSGPINVTMPSVVAWPPYLSNATYNWAVLSPIVPLDQLPSLTTNGLYNNTLFDTPYVDSTSVNATVNVTSLQASCGVLSGLSLGNEFGNPSLNFNFPTGKVLTLIDVPNIWKDTITAIVPAIRSRNGSAVILFWVTAALDIDESVSNDGLSVNTNWSYTPLGGDEAMSQTTAYLVGCSLNTTTTADVLNVQNNTLGKASQLSSHTTPSASWPLWAPNSMTTLETETITAYTSSPLSDIFFPVNSSHTVLNYTLSSMDVYFMSLLGISATEISVLSKTQSSADSSVKLNITQFEDAVAQIAAQYMWVAGHTDGQFGPAYELGENVVTNLTVLRRLNANTIPVVIASLASIILLLLAIYMTRDVPSEQSTTLELGVLETLWLEAHSEVLHERMSRVDDPSLHNLRAAGMFEVCLMDEVRKALDKGQEAAEQY